MSITAFSFGEWLPDLPDLGNPGLTEALNVLPVPGGYGPYFPHSPYSSASTIPSSPLYAIHPYSQNEVHTTVYAHNGTLIYKSPDNGVSWTLMSSTLGSNDPQMVQFRELVVATSANGILIHTLGASSNFSTVSPLTASVIGVIGQFVMIGQMSGTAGAYIYDVQWCAVGDVTNWPTPNTSTAIATQSGRQTLDAELGIVTGIHGRDQYGIILQSGGLTRVTYAGPPVVFQFDKIANSPGCSFKNSSIMIDGLVYYASLSGFYVTDGVTATSISDQRTTNYFLSVINAGSSEQGTMSVGADYSKKIIYWSYIKNGGGGGRALFAYSYVQKRFTRMDDSIIAIVHTSGGSFTAGNPSLEAFNLARVLGTLTGTPGTAIITTGEVEPSPGNCALINGIKPVIASSGSAPTIGVQVGSRDDQATTVSYSSTVTPTARSGFADTRSDARYHRARVYITGSFDRAQGLEIDAMPTGGF